MSAPGDELYDLPLDQFIAARDALASRLKASGDAAAAAEIKKRRKPSVPAWAANLVVRRAAPLWRRLSDAASALRETQGRGAPPEEMRKAVGAQREALRDCERRAAELLAENGHTAGPAVLQKVAHTLLALAYGVPGADAGSLEQELQPPGFEAFAGVSLPDPAPRAPHASPPAAPQKPRALEDAHARAQARARAEAAQRLLARARNELGRAEEHVAALQRQLKDAQQECEDARGRVAAAEQEAEAAERGQDLE
jgi:hypothetical protein